MSQIDKKMRYYSTFSHQDPFRSRNSNKHSSKVLAGNDLKFIRPACGFAMSVKVKTDIYFFCLIFAPNEAM